MTAAATLQGLVEAGLAFLYPEACQVCGTSRAKPGEGLVCGHCFQQVRFIGPPFCGRCGLPYDGAITTPFECANCRELDLHFRFARSAVVAAGMVRDVIHRYKYQRAVWFEPFLADLLVRVAKPELQREDWDLIVPVPLHSTKQREREFNQAARLAAHLGRATQIPVNARLLRRVIATRTQTQLSRAQRVANVRNAFSLRRVERLEGARVLLFDDVLTTGATTSACARVLRQAGAADVGVWTVARAVTFCMIEATERPC